MNIISFELPEYVACYAMYGEPSGDDELESAYDEWFYDTMRHEGFSSMHLVSVDDSNSFMSYHELKDYGIGSCDCHVFTFHATKENTQ